MITGEGDRGLAQAQRVALWLRSEERFYKQQREELRAEWVSYHEKLAHNHRSIADEHEATARRLLEEGGRLEGVNGNGSH